MGKETTIRAFPADWPLIQQVRAGETKGQYLQTAFHCLWTLTTYRFGQDPQVSLDHEEKDPDPDEEYLSAYRQTVELLKASPELLWCRAYLDRQFEVMHYLMCETTEDPSLLDLYSHAVKGRKQIHPEATASQGFPICWNDPETTSKVWHALGPLAFEEIVRHYGTEKYQGQRLYKGGYSRNQAGALHDSFCQLKELYRSASASGHLTVVVVD